MIMKEYKSTGGIYAEDYKREALPTSTSMTKNQSFENNGFLFLPGVLRNPQDIFELPPVDENGKYIAGNRVYQRKDKFVTNETEDQVKGSFSRYNYPLYKDIHISLRKSLELVLGIEVFPTYYFDRFYHTGEVLTRHSDRPSCEVSVTMQISSNGKEPWPIWFELPDGTESYALMNDGDAVVYKGCEREHWRDPLVSRYNKAERLWRKMRGLEDDTYHHQVFFHYVNSQGPFVHHAGDRC